MKNQKWQGITIALIISILASTNFASVNRNVPTPTPTAMPSAKPAPAPTVMPSAKPVPTPTVMPSAKPAPTPTAMPSAKPAPTPTAMPSAKPAPAPTVMPSTKPVPTPIVTPDTKPAPSCKMKSKCKPGSQKQKPFMLDNFKVIATTLGRFGVDEAKLTTYIKEGKKLEDVLRIEKISTRKFKKAIIKEYNKVVDEGVKNKQITCEQSKQLKSAIKQTIKDWLPQK